MFYNLTDEDFKEDKFWAAQFNTIYTILSMQIVGHQNKLSNFEQLYSIPRFFQGYRRPEFRSSLTQRFFTTEIHRFRQNEWAGYNLEYLLRFWNQYTLDLSLHELPIFREQCKRSIQYIPKLAKTLQRWLEIGVEIYRELLQNNPKILEYLKFKLKFERSEKNKLLLDKIHTKYELGKNIEVLDRKNKKLIWKI